MNNIVSFVRKAEDKIRLLIHVARGRPLINNCYFDQTLNIPNGNDDLLIRNCRFVGTVQHKE